MTESGLSNRKLLREIKGTADANRYNFPGFDKDPAIRWRAIINAYSELDLTYETDRLPAIGAIVEREMRFRKDDTYIAGMWVSTLLTDLLWKTDRNPERGLPRLSNSNPTWSWSSSRGGVNWDGGVVVPSLTLVDVSFTRLGPAHIGEVMNASITLEGPTYTTRLRSIYQRGTDVVSPRMDIVSFPCENVEVAVSLHIPVDFDWTSGDRPVTIGDTFLAMQINVLTQYNYSSSSGLILREVGDGNYERMGIISIEPAIEPAFTVEGSGKERTRILIKFIETLPIRQVKII